MGKAQNSRLEDEITDRLLTIQQVSFRLGGRTISAIKSDVVAGILPAPIRMGSRLYWHQSELEKAIAAMPRVETFEGYAPGKRIREAS